MHTRNDTSVEKIQIEAWLEAQAKSAPITYNTKYQSNQFKSSSGDQQISKSEISDLVSLLFSQEERIAHIKRQTMTDITDNTLEELLLRDSSREKIKPYGGEGKEVDFQFNKIWSLRKTMKMDDTRVNEYKKFINWVEEHNHRVPNTAVHRWIHRESVDEYFLHVVLYRKGCRNTISRIASSLQWFYDQLENKDSSTDYDFVVANDYVKTLIKRQQERNDNGLNEDEDCAGTDPHKGIKDLMEWKDKLTIMRYIHKERSDWGSLSTSFSWGNNAAVRGASSRKMGYCDLNMSTGFGPFEDDEDLNRTLMLILRKGNLHKDHYTTDKQVGAYPHKYYLLCSVFNTSMHVINELRQDADINFLHQNKKERASWWDTPLVEFDTYDEESNAMKDVLNKTGVRSFKKTHHRSQAIQLAGSEGLAPWQINTFTKHLIEKLHSAYQSEMDKESLKVMAGSKKGGPYECDYTNVRLALSVEDYVKHLLPNYSRWVEEQKSPNGDKSSCAEKFLYKIIPFLVERLVQGMVFFYLDPDFKNHEMRQWFRVSDSIVYSCYNNYTHTL